jgi:hypothetical protein
MAYEEGMSIQYDGIKKSVRVLFRGKEYKLPGPYRDTNEGMKAGEDFCRGLGWVG